MRNRIIQVVFLAVLMVVLLPYSSYSSQAKPKCDVFLYEPIVFTGGTIRIGGAMIPPVDNVIKGCVSKNKLPDLFNIIISEQRKGDRGDRTIYFFMSGENGERIRTRTCNEYIAARKSGMTTKTERDQRLELYFRKICGALNAFANSTPFKHDHISAKNNLSPNALPVALLHAPKPMGEEYEKLVVDIEKEMSFADYLETNKELFKVIEKARDNPEKTFLETWYGDSEEDGHGFWLELELIAKGDFNKDGYADFLVHVLKVTNKGAWFDSNYVIFSSTNNSNKLYDVYGNDFTGSRFSCTYKDKSYVCGDPSKDTSLPSWSVIE